VLGLCFVANKIVCKIKLQNEEKQFFGDKKDSLCALMFDLWKGGKLTEHCQSSTNAERKLQVVCLINLANSKVCCIQSTTTNSVAHDQGTLCNEPFANAVPLMALRTKCIPI